MNYKIDKIIKDSNTLIKILEESKKDFDGVKKRVVDGSLKIPATHKHLLLSLFKKSTRAKRKHGEELNLWLKQHIYIEERTEISIPSTTNLNYEELERFLHHLDYNSNQLLYNQCIYGYYLDLFFYKHEERNFSGNRELTFKEKVFKHFKLSLSQSTKLRWLGKLWIEHNKIGKLNLSLNAMYEKKKEIENMFQLYPNIKKEWM